MKLGVPVVATPLAVEGTLARDGESCLVAADSQQFAAKVVQVRRGGVGLQRGRWSRG